MSLLDYTAFYLGYFSSRLFLIEISKSPCCQLEFTYMGEEADLGISIRFLRS